jgi:hypothetical protein
MRFLNRPTLDVNDSNQSVYLDTTNNVLGVTGEISLSKDISSDLKTFLKASSALTENYTLTLPTDPGLDGQVLATDGNGTLRFTPSDWGGNRIFVSAKNGNDANDGFNQPVKTIKRAAQIAASFSEPIYDPGQIAKDAQALLRANKAFIAAEVIGFISYCVTYAVFPFTTDFTYNQTTCSRDIGYIIEAVTYDLIFGGNAQSIYAGNSYYSATAELVISDQKDQSIAAMNYAKYVSEAVLNNTPLTPTVGGLYDYASYQFATVDSNGDPAPTTIEQTIDLTKTSITLSLTGTITSTSTTTTITGISNVSTLCAGMVLTKNSGDGDFGGATAITNVNYITSVVTIKSTISNTTGSINFTGSAIGAIKNSYDIITGILANGLDTGPTQVNPLYIPLPVTIQIAAGEYYEDNPIITPDKSTIIGDDLRSVIIRPLNAGKDMFRVRNGMYMSGFTFRDALNRNPLSTEYGKPTHTWGYSIAFDDVRDFTVNRAAYIGLSPSKVISTLSPYIQNCSIISFLGGNGCLIDGSKVTSPNVPRIYEEVENPVSVPVPSQGKSMVANAFTMVSFGGTGWKIINDAYCQLVSCFQLFLLNGVYCESGGYCSITNSATNFGLNALRSAGYSPTTFDFDKGIIANIGSDNSLQTITSLGHGRVPVNHYILKIINYDTLEDETGVHKAQVEEYVEIDAATAINNSTYEITTLTNHGLSNGTTVLYSNEGNADIYGLLSGDIYYVYYVSPTVIKLYYDGSLTKLVNIHTGTGTHKFTQNIEDFFINEITDSHSSYQKLTLSSNSHTFVPGNIIYGTVGVQQTSAYVYSWNAVNSELVVSLINVSTGGQQDKVLFTNSSTITSDAGVSINITVTSFENISNLYTATYTIRSTVNNNSLTGTSILPSKRIWLNKPSIVNSSGHTWEYAGSGTDYNALPDNGGKTIVALQQVAELPGRVYTSGTNELGDFTVGNFITAYNRTGNIVFSNKVTVSELTALKLSLSDISITAISTDIGLGDNEQGGPSNTRLTTQLAQRSFLANRLGDFIDKHISTSSVPAAIVQLNGNGQINADLIPPVRGFNTHLINSYNGRLSVYEKIPVEEILAGDVISETYYEKVLTLSGNITVAAGDKISQDSTGIYGIVKTATVNNIVTLVLYSSDEFDFDPLNNYNLTKSTIASNYVTTSSLDVYIESLVEQTNSDSYYLTIDNSSQFLRLLTTNNYRFTIGNQVSAAVNEAVGDISDYRCGFITVLGSLIAGSGYYYDSVITDNNIYRNIALTGGTGKYTSAAGATNSGTTITVTSTTGLEIGMLVTVTAGTGAFAAGTTVADIASSTEFTVSTTLTTPLSSGAVIRADATGARADISINSDGTVGSVDLYRGGVGYQVGDVLSAASANIGGSVTVPFSVTVTSIEKRLYVDITNNYRFTATNVNYNFIQDNNANSFSFTLDDDLVISFNANSIAVPGGQVDYDNNQIILPSHGLAHGDPLNYSSNGNARIEYFDEHDTFYVKVIDPDTIELYVDYSRLVKKIFGGSAVGTHKLTRYAVDIHSNHLVKVGHGLERGQAIRISNFSDTAPTAIINGSENSVLENSYWFVGSKTDNSFTLHEYSVDANNSRDGETLNELDFVSSGVGTCTFEVQNVTVTSVVNTSSKNAENYSILSNTSIDASGIISGTINTTRLGSGNATSSTYLRGDSYWHTVTESISKGPNSPISLSGNYTTGTISITGLEGNIDTTSTTTTVSGLSSTAQLFTGMTLTKTGGSAGFGGTATITSINNSTTISISTTSSNTAGTIVFTAESTVDKYYGDAAIDIVRVDNNLTGSGTYTNVGIASYDKTYLDIGTGSTIGRVSVKQGVIDAGTLGGAGKNSLYYLTPSNFQSLVPINKGGTNLNAYAQGDILYAPSVNSLAGLNIGSPGYVLTVEYATGTAPIWIGYTGSAGSLTPKIVYNEGPTINYALDAGSTTFDLVNTTATTLNFAGDTTSLNIGYNGSNASTTNISTGPIKASTTKTINIGTGGNYDSTTTVNLGYTGSGSANINIGSDVSGTTTIRSGTVVGALTTQNVFNTVATTVNAFGAATAINIGAATGTLTISNPTITGTNATTFNMNGSNPSISTGNTGTASVFDTNALTGKLFGSATTINIGYVGSANSTTVTQNYSIGYVGSNSTRTVNFATGYIGSNATSTVNVATGYLGSNSTNTINVGTGFVGSNATNTINVGTGGVSTNGTTTVNIGANTGYTGSGSTNVNIGSDIGGTTTIKSSIVVGYLGSQALFNTTATTVNFAGAATTINIGATTGTLTINNPTVVGSQTTQNLYNTTATTMNFAGAATTSTVGYVGSSATTIVTQNYSIGYVGSSSTSTVNFATGYIGSNATSTTNIATGYLGSNSASTINIGTGYIGSNGSNTINIGTGGVSTGATTTVNVGTNAGYTGSGSTNVNIGSDIGGTTTIRSSIVVGYLGSQALYNTTATTMNFAGAATSLTIGATTGTMTLRNATIVGANSTQTLFNTVATTVNAFAAATSLTLGYTSTAASTTNISTGAVAALTTKTVNIGTGGNVLSITNVNIGGSTGTTTVNGTLTVNGNYLTVGNTETFTSTGTGITNSAAAQVDGWVYSLFRSAKYTAQVTCTLGTNINTYQVSEILVIHNGATATMTEYGAIKTTNDLATFTVDFNTTTSTNTITAVATGTSVTLGTAASYTIGTPITTGASLAVGSSGLAVNTTYYVAATTSSSTTVTLSATYGGGAITFTSTLFSVNNTVNIGNGQVRFLAQAANSGDTITVKTHRVAITL